MFPFARSAEVMNTSRRASLAESIHDLIFVLCKQLHGVQIGAPWYAEAMFPREYCLCTPHSSQCFLVNIAGTLVNKHELFLNVV